MYEMISDRVFTMNGYLC